jgi:hypothetical protein
MNDSIIWRAVVRAELLPAEPAALCLAFISFIPTRKCSKVDHRLLSYHDGGVCTLTAARKAARKSEGKRRSRLIFLPVAPPEFCPTAIRCARAFRLDR